MSQPCQTHVCAGSTSSLRSTCCTAFGKIVCLRETKSVRACVSTYHSTRAHAYPHVHTHRHRAERAEMQQALREDAAVLTALARDSPQAFSQVCVSECRVHAETVRNMFSLSLSLSLTHTHTHTHTHTCNEDDNMYHIRPGVPRGIGRQKYEERGCRRRKGRKYTFRQPGDTRSAGRASAECRGCTPWRSRAGSDAVLGTCRRKTEGVCECSRALIVCISFCMYMHADKVGMCVCVCVCV